MADTDLLKPVAPEEKWHPYFKALITFAGLAPARDMIREVWGLFPNPDNHFELEFQTTGLDARIWELCVFAVGYYGGFTLTRPHEAPDFLFARDGIEAWVEVTTANRSEKFPVKQAETVDDSIHHMHDYLPIRLGGALTAKLKKEYWTQEHVKGKPLIIALEDFSENDPFRVDTGSLFRYLWGLDCKVVSIPGEPVKLEYFQIEEHEHEGKKIPSGFFNLPAAEYVSAIIFSCEGTIPKFKRMGFDFEKHPFVRMIRFGNCANYDPTATLPEQFGYMVGDAPEEWTHGMYVYHNPNAMHPLPRSFFKGFGGQHWIENGVLDNQLRDFAPMGSMTLTLAIEGGEGSLASRDAKFREMSHLFALRLKQMFETKMEFHAWRDKFVGAEGKEP